MKTRGIALTLATACMFGLGTVLGKLATASLHPLLVTFLNFLLGGILLLLFLSMRRISLRTNLKRDDWMNVLLVSVLGTALPACCVIIGLGLTSAIKAGFLLQFQGISSILFAVIFLHEKLNRKQIAGILLLLLGSALVVIKNMQTSVWGSLNIGDGLVLLGALGFGYAILPSKQLAPKIDSLPLIVWKLLISALVVLPILATRQAVIPPHISSALYWIMPIYIISNFCIAYVTQQESLKYLQGWEAATVMQSMPIFSTIFAILLLGDSLSLLQISGGMIALAGGCVVALTATQRAATKKRVVIPQEAPQEGILH
ncbi:DMT family transporter [Dictyobacter arantiisoli]|uniref:DMT family transporter n=1 Tax=Dictyobacter arantiisoli TaxID=2014874 RepID=UPI0011EE12AB|nr:DMT family transporter [Dictyobacter arantiisoli]